MFIIEFLISNYYIDKKFDSYFHFSEKDKMKVVDWESRYVSGAIIIKYDDASILDTTIKHCYCYPVYDILCILDGIKNYMQLKTQETFVFSGDEGTFFLVLKKTNNGQLLYENRLDQINRFLPEQEFFTTFIYQSKLFYEQLFEITNIKHYKDILDYISTFPYQEI